MVKSKALALLWELSVPNLATLNPIFYLSFSAGINPMNLMYAKYVSSLNLNNNFFLWPRLTWNSLYGTHVTSFFFFQTVSHYGLEYVLSFQQSIFNFICLSLSGCGFVYMSAVARGQKRTGSPGTEIIGDSELPKVGAGNQNQSSTCICWVVSLVPMAWTH